MNAICLTRSGRLLLTLGSSAVVVLILNITFSNYFSNESRSLLDKKYVAGETALYADESSPLYLEPYRHQETENVAWKWAADLRSRKKSLVVPITPSASADALRSTMKQAEARKPMKRDISRTLQLTEVDSNSRPCPWYGCADGSHADFSERKTSHVSEFKTPHPKEPKRIVPQEHHDKIKHNLPKLLAHGYGTSNSFTAKPLTSEKNQFYGGSPRFYGSSRPVTSASGFVDGSQAYSVDMAPAYDMSDPTSFDSIPLASPSSPESRVSLAQPAGDGTLTQNIFR